MNETVRLTVIVEARKTSDGRSFNVYKARTKNGALVDLKFRKSVTKIPTEKSVIVCPIDAVNKASNTEFPLVWVSDVLEIEPIGVANAEANRKTVRDMFGE